MPIKFLTKQDFVHSTYMIIGIVNREFLTKFRLLRNSRKTIIIVQSKCASWIGMEMRNQKVETHFTIDVRYGACSVEYMKLIKFQA